MRADILGNFSLNIRSFNKGKRDGKGRLTFGNGIYYDGAFKDNEFVEGVGKVLMVGNKKYEGDLKEGKCHGEGTMISEDGRKFRGSFLNGKKEGKGQIIWPDGRKFSGSWKNNERDGEGLYINDEG